MNYDNYFNTLNVDVPSNVNGSRTPSDLESSNRSGLRLGIRLYNERTQIGNDIRLDVERENVKVTVRPLLQNCFDVWRQSQSPQQLHLPSIGDFLALIPSINDSDVASCIPTALRHNIRCFQGEIIVDVKLHNDGAHNTGFTVDSVFATAQLDQYESDRLHLKHGSFKLQNNQLMTQYKETRAELESKDGSSDVQQLTVMTVSHSRLISERRVTELVGKSHRIQVGLFVPDTIVVVVLHTSPSTQLARRELIGQTLLQPC